MSEGLKNCPFCGGEPEITQAIENDPTSLVATCPDDDCVGSTIRCSIDLWNTRATPTIERIDGLYDAISFEDLPMPETEEELKRYERRHKDHRDIYGQEIHETIEKAARAYLKLMEKKNVRRKMEIAKRPPDQQQRDGCV